MKLDHLEGLIPAPHTPMHADCEINLAAIEQQAQLFMNNNISAAYICGSTGEGLSLTVNERIDIMKKWVEAAGSEIKVIANVGHTCLKDAQMLAEAAEKFGVYAISAMPPCYYKPKTPEDLVDFYAGIANSAPKTPFYAYHTPIMSGVCFSMLDVLKLASEKIKTLAGIKYNHSDLMDYGLCRNYKDGRYEILFGIDELLLSSLPYGTKAAIGSTYNYAAPLYFDIIEQYRLGNMEKACSLQSRSAHLVNVLLKYGVLQAGKSIMKLVGVDCGPTRLPVRPLTSKQFDDLQKDLDAIGFFEMAVKKPVKHKSMNKMEISKAL
ncbi:MAG: dihydrodipicolinate synthase family protein [Phycisphaerales bacterium]